VNDAAVTPGRSLTRLADLLEPDEFVRRHIGPSADDVTVMLKAIGLSSIDELIDETLPASIRSADALDLPDAVPEDVKEARRARFMAVQAVISARRLAAKVGRTLDVLVDAVEPGHATARTAGDAPEIDGVVRVTGGRPVAGEFLRVRITAADEHDLDAVAIG